MLFLKELNLETWHDAPLAADDDYDMLRMIDRQIHPKYLRLVEGILMPLVRPIAYFSRLGRKRGVDDLANVLPIVQELKGGTEENLILPYRHIIRNGIAHGGIVFLQRQIRYRDKKGNEDTFDSRYVIRLLDDMADICNGIVAALKVFFLVSQDQGYVPPRELLIQALQQEAWAPWWNIEGLVEAEVLGRSQLTVYARLASRDLRKILWSTLQTGVLTGSLVPGYDRYFLSFRTSKSFLGWAAFEGDQLRDLREAVTSDPLLYGSELLGNDFFFFTPRPVFLRFLDRLETLIHSLRNVFPVEMHKRRDRAGNPRIYCRQGSIHRNGWGAVLKVDVVIGSLDKSQAREFIWQNRRRLVRLGGQFIRKQNRWMGSAMLPLGYARIAVFKRDYRLRRLSGFGLGEDLVCTVVLQRIRRIKAPDLFGSTLETKGNWRIAWNRAWLTKADPVA